MKNYLKMTLAVFTLVFFVSNVSAGYYFDVNTYTDTISYSEDVVGEHRGFSVTYPEDKYENDCGYYDWTYDLRKCKRTAYYDKYYVEYYGYNVNKDRYSYDKDAIMKEAFKTYQQSSKQQYQLESQRMNLEHRRSYYYGGYGYGYSGIRYY